MTERSVRHGSFTIERNYPASPAQVFKAWADPKAKAQWFGGTGDWKEIIREFDFRVGGRERLKGQWANDKVHDFECRYQDIVPNERIVYTYDMHIDETRISVSLSTVEFKAAASGTRLVYTEHSAFLDDFDDAGGREHGTKILLDRLGAAQEG
jgi:uncharacterized protein YndB with AHSA1/START domain